VRVLAVGRRERSADDLPVAGLVHETLPDPQFRWGVVLWWHCWLALL